MVNYKFKDGDWVRIAPHLNLGNLGAVMGVGHALPGVGVMYIVRVAEPIPDYPYSAILIPESALDLEI